MKLLKWAVLFNILYTHANKTPTTPFHQGVLDSKTPTTPFSIWDLWFMWGSNTNTLIFKASAENERDSSPNNENSVIFWSSSCSKLSLLCLTQNKLFWRILVTKQLTVAIDFHIQWGKKVFSQPPIVQVLPLKKMREACNCHHRYTSTMRDKIRKKIQKITL